MKAGIQGGVILLMVLVLAGCLSSGVVRNAGPIATGTPVSLDFAQVETSSTVGGSEVETQLLKDLVVSELRGRGIFEEVGAEPVTAGVTNGIKIKVVIKAIKKISQGERDWGGVFAGQARIAVAATVSDLSSGKVVEVFEAEGESSGGSNLAGTTEEAVQRAAEQVVTQVVLISSKTSF